ncbi:MAG: hypothetical protein V7L20_08780 [Nostoc sp.]|uniref:hypothetical protein n=1 Tax=Nostoc sp. TaxID=1180 RepID=UPI002FFC8911
MKPQGAVIAGSKGEGLQLFLTMKIVQLAGATVYPGIKRVLLLIPILYEDAFIVQEIKNEPPFGFTSRLRWETRLQRWFTKSAKYANK